MLKKLLSFWLILVGANIFASVESGESVVVVYNSLLPKSKEVAEHYASVRQVPSAQLLGLELPNAESMSRAQFKDDLQKPLLKWLEDKQLLNFKMDSSDTNSAPHWRVQEAKVRYVVLCYGVPLRILEDNELKESVDNVPPALRRNGAAVDSELTLLPMEDYKMRLAGPLRNPFFGTTNAATLNPISGVLLVARLDGPTPEIARQLVDKAVEAETDGLWGRAYFDSRSLPEFKSGDEMILHAAQSARRFGFETIVDEKPETFSQSFPMSQIALYAGWYNENVSGPFALPNVEFMQGAIAYHLHSFSAATLRSTNSHWVGPFLVKGVTATMGCVDEPFVDGTPNIGLFFDCLFHGYSFGEAAWASAPVLSWQTTVVGDPLYRPFGKHPQEQHEHLAAKKSKLIEWSHLRVANLNLTQGYPVSEVIDYLAKEAKESAVLTEKLGDLYAAQGKAELAKESYRKALSLHPSPQQENRLKGLLAEKQSPVANDGKAEEKKSGSSK